VTIARGNVGESCKTTLVLEFWKELEGTVEESVGNSPSVSQKVPHWIEKTKLNTI